MTRHSSAILYSGPFHGIILYDTTFYRTKNHCNHHALQKQDFIISFGRYINTLEHISVAVQSKNIREIFPKTTTCNCCTILRLIPTNLIFASHNCFLFTKVFIKAKTDVFALFMLSINVLLTFYKKIETTRKHTYLIKPFENIKLCS